MIYSDYDVGGFIMTNDVAGWFIMMFVNQLYLDYDVGWFIVWFRVIYKPIHCIYIILYLVDQVMS